MLTGSVSESRSISRSKGENPNHHNIFLAHIRGRYNQVFSKYINNAKSVKTMGKMLKEDKKWLKKIKSGAMEDSTECYNIEEHFVGIFNNENHPVNIFMKDFVRFVRKTFHDLVDSLFANPKRIIDDFSQSTKFIIDVIITNYDRVLSNLGKGKFPTNKMMSLISTYISENNGKDVIRLFKKFICVDDNYKKFLKAREFLYLERLNLANKRLLLPDEPIPYEKPMKILQKITNTFVVEQQMEYMVETFDSIFEHLDRNKVRENLSDEDLSLIIAYIILNADIFKTPAWMEYIRIFSETSTVNDFRNSRFRRPISKLFINVSSWILNDVEITMEWERQKEIEDSKNLERLSSTLRRRQDVWELERKKIHIIEQNKKLQKKIFKEEKKKRESSKRFSTALLREGLRGVAAAAGIKFGEEEEEEEEDVINNMEEYEENDGEMRKIKSVGKVSVIVTTEGKLLIGIEDRSENSTTATVRMKRKEVIELMKELDVCQEEEEEEIEVEFVDRKRDLEIRKLELELRKKKRELEKKDQLINDMLRRQLEYPVTQPPENNNDDDYEESESSSSISSDDEEEERSARMSKLKKYAVSIQQKQKNGVEGTVTVTTAPSRPPRPTRHAPRIPSWFRRQESLYKSITSPTEVIVDDIEFE